MNRVGSSIAVVFAVFALFSPRDVSAQDALQLVPMRALAPRVRIDAPRDLVVYAARVGPGAVRPRAQRICIAPCERRLTPGRYTVAVGRAGDRPIAVEETVPILRDQTDLRVRVHSNAGIRTLGHLLGVTGLALTIASCFAPSLVADEAGAPWALGIGLGLGITVATTGAVLAFEPDDVVIERGPR